MQIGPYQIKNPLVLAPMAGVSDGAMRALCLENGAGMVVSEMVASDALLYGSNKTQWRLKSVVKEEPKVVQIVGNDPKMMAEAAQLNVDLGAEIIDINMGCPAKKVCQKLAGSALLKDEALVAKILTAIVNAVTVPVTLKIRTGWDKATINALSIGKLAQDIGIQALTIHGRTRDCRFKGEAEYETIRQVKETISIPVIANGDINSAKKAKAVLAFTKADALMIGRAAQGNPWIFNEIMAELNNTDYQKPTVSSRFEAMDFHLNKTYEIYGEYSGVRIARKHFSWYSQGLRFSNEHRHQFNSIENSRQQLQFIKQYQQRLMDGI